MPTSSDRREPAGAFRQRKAARGIFAVKCTSTRQVWVESAPNLDAARNGLWFFLRNGLHRDSLLQGLWRAHGEGAFRFEVLETLGDDVDAPATADVLQRKKDEWIVKLKALAIRQ